VPAKHPLFSIYTRTCYLDQRTVAEYIPPAVASKLVHEAVHARLRCAGLGSYGADLAVRVEELCIDEEIAFAQRLPRDEYPGVDDHLRYLHTLRREYPPTQSWPRRWW
jgi:hypothetical protein